MKKITIALLLALAVAFAISACFYSGGESTSDEPGDESHSTIFVEYDSDDMDSSSVGSNMSYIMLEGDSISLDGSGAMIKGNIITITSAGMYSISGTLYDGQIIVNTEDNTTVKLVLNGADITCSTSAPIYIINAAKTVITLADATENHITDGDSYIFEDAASDDLTINGGGSLIVKANYNNGITSKDDLKITGGSITIDAVNDGIKGRDCIGIKDGTITLNAGGDGMQSNNDEDSEKGFVFIEGGMFNIIAVADGIQAETGILITGGNMTIATGGGNTVSTTDTAKGIKAGLDVTIEDGNIKINSADDSIHSDDNITINGGQLTLASGDDAIHADSSIEINDGDINITKCYEGIESKNITINDGDIHLVSSDDGIDADAADDSIQTYVCIGGGTFYITAGADGIQAKTKVLISGGSITISSGGGSTLSTANSAKGIKVDLDVTIEDGTIKIDSADDSIHSDDSITINGGQLTLASGDDGIHADSTIEINDGDINITKCYEGIESSDITINDGSIRLVSNDDGINAVSGNDGTAIPGRPGRDAGDTVMPGRPGQESGDNSLYINGGYIVVDALGDGFDVNGPVYMTSGSLIINGPIRNDNGALDYTGVFQMSGGFLIAVGSAGMAQAPSASSTQDSAALRYSSVQAAGTMVHIQTEDGEGVLTFVPTKAYQSVVLCSPQLKEGVTYIVYSGGSSTGAVTDGLYSGGTYTPGTELGSFTL
jgi:hypothetical protein